MFHNFGDEPTNLRLISLLQDQKLDLFLDKKRSSRFPVNNCTLLSWKSLPPTNGKDSWPPTGYKFEDCSQPGGYQIKMEFHQKKIWCFPSKDDILNFLSGLLIMDPPQFLSFPSVEMLFPWFLYSFTISIDKDRAWCSCRHFKVKTRFFL